MINIIEVDESEAERLISVQEGHFADLKSKDVAPGKLTQTICALANADGGEVLVGIEDSSRVWSGFPDVEAANGHIQAFEKLFPLGHGFFYNFLSCASKSGYVLRVEILKSNTIVQASNGIAYLRRSAQNLPQSDGPSLERLRRNKGISSFETEMLNNSPEVITDSGATAEFMGLSCQMPMQRNGSASSN